MNSRQKVCEHSRSLTFHRLIQDEPASHPPSTVILATRFHASGASTSKEGQPFEVHAIRDAFIQRSVSVRPSSFSPLLAGGATTGVTTTVSSACKDELLAELGDRRTRLVSVFDIPVAIARLVVQVISWILLG